MVIEALEKEVEFFGSKFDIYVDPTMRELDGIPSYQSYRLIRMLYEVDTDKMYAWDRSILHDYAIRYLEYPKHTIRISVDFPNLKIRCWNVDSKDDLKKLKANKILKRMKHYFPGIKITNVKFHTHVTETLIKRENYLSRKIGVDKELAQNAGKIDLLVNKRSGKQYVEKGYEKSLQHRISSSLMAGYEFMGYYIANRIVKDYELKGIGVPMPSGITTVNGELKLLLPLVKGGSMTDRRISSTQPMGKRRWVDAEDEAIGISTRLSWAGYPLMDVVGNLDMHEGNIIVSPSSIIHFIDFELAFRQGDHIDTMLIKDFINDFTNPEINRSHKRLIRFFFYNLSRLSRITPEKIAKYAQAGVKKIEHILKNDDPSLRKDLLYKLNRIFIDTDGGKIEMNILHDNILHLKDMYHFAKVIISRKKLTLLEGMEFNEPKYKTANVGYNPEYEPINISAIKKIENEKNKKLYVKKQYVQSDYGKDIAGIFEYATYKAIKDLKKSFTIPELKVPKTIFLNFNDENQVFELLTSIDLNKARSASSAFVSPEKPLSHIHFDSITIPLMPIMILLGSFDTHLGNVIISKTKHYLIDFERGLTSTRIRGGKEKNDFEEMEELVFNKVSDMVLNFYDKSQKHPVKRSSVIKLLKNIEHMDVKTYTGIVINSLVKTEEHVNKILHRTEMKENKRRKMINRIGISMSDARQAVKDNSRYVTNYINKIKAMPTFKQILADNAKVKAEYDDYEAI